MSLNQISQPNTYLPAVSFNDMKVNNETITGRLLLPAGTVSAPSLSYINSQTTGMYNPTSKVISFSSNASERFRIDGIRNTSLFPFRIASNFTTSPNDYIECDNVAGDTRLRVIGDGNCSLNFETPSVNTVKFQIGNTGVYSYIRSPSTIQFQNLFGVSSVQIGTTVNQGITLANSTAGYNPTALNYYEEYTSPALTITGGNAPVLNYVVKIVRVGKQVTIQLPEFSAIGNNDFFTCASAIPVRFRPVNNVNFYCVVFDTTNVPVAPNQANGHIDLIVSNGDLQIYRTPNQLTFPIGSLCGIRNCAISYLCN